MEFFYISLNYRVFLHKINMQVVILKFSAYARTIQSTLNSSDILYTEFGKPLLVIFTRFILIKCNNGHKF